MITGTGEVGTSSAQLDERGFVGHQKLLIKANAANEEYAIFVGNEGVTPETGYALYAGDSVELNMVDTASVWVCGESDELSYSWLLI